MKTAGFCSAGHILRTWLYEIIIIVTIVKKDLEILFWFLPEHMCLYIYAAVCKLDNIIIIRRRENIQLPSVLVKPTLHPNVSQWMD